MKDESKSMVEQIELARTNESAKVCDIIVENGEQRMSLIDYYKSYAYNYAYNKGYADGLEKDPHPNGDQHDIYWQDEMDYMLCADYYGSFVGGKEDWKEEDKKFLEGLGLEPEDFEE